MSKSEILKGLFRDENGATAVEYGLILAMVVLAMLAALSGVASETTNMWNDVSSKTEKAVKEAGI